jgi:phosphosulfolactate synthase
MIELPHVPQRGPKPRTKGITMVMDKGLSLRQAEDMISASGDLIDFVKLGFGTSYVSNNVNDKIALYKSAGIRPYLGGTFFEAFMVRNMFEDYMRLVVDKLKLDTVEVSDGSILINHDSKCGYISKLAQYCTVLSEVGSKEAGILISPNKWKQMMHDELQAGAWKVIAEARESGNVGIYRPSGKAHVSLIHKILNKIKQEDIIWEAPIKSQQVYFIKLLGYDVNLGNIAPDEVIPLETLRLGLRGDTFFTFLPKEVAQGWIPEYKDDEQEDLSEAKA